MHYFLYAVTFITTPHNGLFTNLAKCSGYQIRSTYSTRILVEHIKGGITVSIRIVNIDLMESF
ncbi:MAG TPA: hypothetical protein VJ599_03170 [Nitrososphaeraceae archaeon]|nr:hypothetical protein [Nitrososphaeraceae archaeon]